MKKSKLVMPVLKWVGGKRQLLPEIKKYMPTISKNTTYYEPFVGGGAVLFDMQPNKAVINDVNHDLIDVYKVIKDNVEDLIAELKKEKYANTSEAFYKIRELDRKPNEFNKLTGVQKAARILYLNKTCYNGLYRVNSVGEFNSPFGRYKNPNIINDVGLRAVSKYFNDSNITFLSGDFESALKGIKKGSVVYFDPPYAPISKTSNFTGYNESGFGLDEQTRLRNLCDKLTDKGVHILLSNSDCEMIRTLYSDKSKYKIIQVKAKRTINSVASSRGEVSEVLITNNV